jgi:hypothetical protein
VQERAPQVPEPYAGPWVWLFPAAYLAHLAEEYWAPPTFPDWASRFAGIDFTVTLFLAANALFLTLMVIAIVLVLRRVFPPWMILAIATVLALNGVLHLVGTACSGAYSPGLVTGLLVYVPLGAVVLGRMAPRLGRGALLRGVLAGVVIHSLVPVAGLLLSWILP